MIFGASLLESMDRSLLRVFGFNQVINNVSKVFTFFFLSVLLAVFFEVDHDSWNSRNLLLLLLELDDWHHSRIIHGLAWHRHVHVGRLKVWLRSVLRPLLLVLKV